ncbi:MAG: hypothetical protein FWG20_03765, partial [Candidatus Cloacimonetes bacterium]|nr:hypothetical protein [Candidatus Cloacimonadota bacterium]
GIWWHNSYRKNELNKITVTRVFTENQTPFSIDVIFEVKNETLQYGKKPFLIEAYTNNGVLIATKLVNIEIQSKSTTRFVKVLDKFERKLREDEEITIVTVKLYHRKAF